MDDTDYRLIALLRNDARLPVSSLAASLGISRATVRARLSKLQESGIILGFSVILKKEGRGNAVHAITMIEVEGLAAEKVIRRLYGFPEVRSIHTTNGRWDIVAEVETDSLASFDLVLQRIRLIEGIASTETSILLASRKTAEA